MNTLAKWGFLFQCAIAAIARGSTMVLSTLRQGWLLARAGLGGLRHPSQRVNPQAHTTEGTHPFMDAHYTPAPRIADTPKTKQARGTLRFKFLG